MGLTYAAALAIQSVAGRPTFLSVGSLTSLKEMEQLSCQIGGKKLHPGILHRQPRFDSLMGAAFGMKVGQVLASALAGSSECAVKVTNGRPFRL